MPFLIDLSIVAIILFCAWRGYRAGLVRGALAVVGFIVAIVVANIVASTYAEEFSGILHPFVGGIIETTITDVIDENIDLDDLNLDDIDLEGLGIDDFDNIDDLDLGLFDFGDLDLGNLPGGLAIPVIEFATAYAALRHVGLPETAANRIAEIVSQEIEEEITIGGFADTITSRLSNALSHILLFGIGFALISIAFAVIGNLVSIAFVLPGLRVLDTIAGTALGLVKGLIIVFAITAVIRYVGIFFSSIVEETSVLRFFINNNPVANILGL